MFLFHFLSGASSAEYSNQDFTVGIKVYTGEEYLIATIDTSFLFKTVANAETCAGFGVSVCMSIFDGGFGPGFTFDFVHEQWNSNEDEIVNSMSYTFSYATSGEPDSPGRNSTMLLVPSLTIVFTKTLRVVFDKGLCAATGSDITTFSVDDGGDNFKVCQTQLDFILTFTEPRLEECR
jgi:hypothetical protein